MAAFIFMAVLELLLIVGIPAIIYMIFISPLLKKKKQEKEKLARKQSELEILAQLKLLSNNSKEIELFVSMNADQLSVPTATSLISRVEQLRIDELLEKEFDDSQKRVVVEGIEADSSDTIYKSYL